MKALEAWVARDEDGSLYLYLAKPRKSQRKWLPNIRSDLIGLSRESFPEVKWEDEEATELTFTFKNKGNMKLKSTLEAWVARDKDGSLYMYTAKPEKKSDFWHAPEAGYMKLDDSLFPELQWSDEEPKGIRLSIRNNMEKSKIKSALSSLCRIALFVFILLCTMLGILDVILWIIWLTFRT